MLFALYPGLIRKIDRFRNFFTCGTSLSKNEKIMELGFSFGKNIRCASGCLIHTNNEEEAIENTRHENRRE